MVFNPIGNGMCTTYQLVIRISLAHPQYLIVHVWVSRLFLGESPAFNGDTMGISWGHCDMKGIPSSKFI